MRLMNKVALSALVMGLLAGCGSETEEVVLSPAQEQAVAERLAPEGHVTLESDVVSVVPVAAASSEPRSGEQIYNLTCHTCHAAGVAGAPMLGDKEAWAPRIAQGMETLYKHALSGLNAMPPKGLCMDCSEEELDGAVDYMVSKAK
jgi:cytochrome c5